jgi:hypothetical protein
MKTKCMHPLNHVFAYHIDTTTLADGDYELIPEPEVEISEDPGNIVGNLTEALNQSSKNSLQPPTPLEKASPGHKPATLFTLQSTFIYIYILVH